jgi:Flp pilus assembly protein TadD
MVTPDSPSATGGAPPPGCLRKAWAAVVRAWPGPGHPARPILGALFICGLALLTYRPVLPGSFLMDDQRLVELENPLVTGQMQPASIWFQMDFPLSTLANWLEWRAWGKSPAGYHFVNLMLQALSAVLLWHLLAALKIRGAWLGGALFAVHPVCVNSVARIAEIKNTLSLPFFLLSILCYLRYEASTLYPKEPPTNARSTSGPLWYALSLLAFVLALLSKTSTVMLPVVLLAGAAWQRGRLTRRDLAHTSPHFAIALAFGLMSAWFQKFQALAGETLAPSTFPERLALAGRAFWFYLGKALLPVNLNLAYPRWNVDARTFSAFLPWLLIVAGLALCWRFRRRWGRHVLFGVGCFAILLFPALGFFDARFLVTWQVSDHLQYLPLIAIVSLVAAGVASMMKPGLQCGASIALLAAASALTIQRAHVFSTEENLMRDTLAKNPASSEAHNDLGIILARRQQYSEAMDQFSNAVQCNSNNAAAQVNLGNGFALLGNLPQAEAHLSSALRLKPNDPDAHAKLAKVLIAQGRNREALLHLQTSVRFHPSIDTELELAMLLYRTGNYTNSVAQYRRILARDPDQTEALNNLAWLLATCGDEKVRDGAEAVRCAERACRLTQFKQSGFISTLAAAYAEAGRFSEAVSTAETALRLQQSAGDSNAARINQQLLQFYRAGKPWHERPASTGGR